MSDSWLYILEKEIENLLAAWKSMQSEVVAVGNDNICEIEWKNRLENTFEPIDAYSMNQELSKCTYSSFLTALQT